MAYQISYTETARHDLRLLPGNYRQRLKRLIESLVEMPRPLSAKELRAMPNHYRIRVDNWRLIYRVDDDTSGVLILCVRYKTGPETYQNLE